MGGAERGSLRRDAQRARERRLRDARAGRARSGAGSGRHDPHGPESSRGSRMNGSQGDSGYPRQLLPREKELIEWILPQGAPGYRAYRELIGGMVVLGEGRRGEGEIILGPAGMEPDFSSPLAPLLAYGSIEFSDGTASISLREIQDGQISVEIVSQRSEELPPTPGEVRRWTYSLW